MNTPRGIASFRALREQPLWRLLAADKAPVVIALLQDLLGDGERSLPVSVFLERLSRGLDQLRVLGEELQQAAQAYLADWLTQGWLVRRLPAGASEEQVELSSDAAQAIRFIVGLTERRGVANESRLANVIRQLVRLAEETDTNPDSRVAALEAERARIDRDIALIRTRGVVALDEARAIERAREIIGLSDELLADFRRVRDDFDELNRGLRMQLVENEGSRGDVLESVFAGIDLIDRTEQGKTFNAFWRLLTNPEESELLREALDAVGKRAFVRALSPRERTFLVRLVSQLMDAGSGVHDVLQNFARSLKSFVQSREFLEQRRLHALLREATQAGHALRDVVRPGHDLGFELVLTTSKIRSATQASLYDPAERLADVGMHDAAVSDIDLALIGELVRQSEIDLRSLRSNLRMLLSHLPSVSIAQALEHYPAEQGLGSVVGYVALGVKHGHVTEQRELVSWLGKDAVRRHARVPTIYFTRESHHGLID